MASEAEAVTRVDGPARPTASILTIGSELVEGLRLDTNTREIAFALASAGYRVREAVSVGDDIDGAAECLARLCGRDALVVVTGGLGPTHDDITREAASRALGLPLVRDLSLVRSLTAGARRHTDPRATEQVFRQADVLEGALIIPAVKGTAPGQLVPTPAGRLALFPGPPAEMRPMLEHLVQELAPGPHRPARREMGCVGISESDAQVKASAALEAFTGVELTVLAGPGDVRIILFDEGAGEATLARAAEAVAQALGDRVYATDEASLPQVVVDLARQGGLTVATAESCTGGMVGAALTDVPGSSDVFVGGVVTYADAIKTRLLGVSSETLRSHGAVSRETAEEMARGALERLHADVAVSVTGVAGPDGGSEEKPVGLVWFAVATAGGTHASSRRLPGDRAAVRIRATSTAIDLVRLTIVDMLGDEGLERL